MVEDASDRVDGARRAVRPVRLSVVAAALLALAVLAAGCGGGGGSNDPVATKDGVTLYTDPPSQQPMTTPGQAMTAFGSYFGYDGTECDQAPPELRGRVSERIWDAYSCKTLLSAHDIARGCELVNYGASAPPRLPGSATRKTQVISWQGLLKCPGSAHQKPVDGTVRVTVSKVAAGWVVTAFRALTGPGAGSSVG